MSEGLPWWHFLIIGSVFTFGIIGAIVSCVIRCKYARRAGNRGMMPPPMQPGTGMRMGGQGTMTPSQHQQYPQAQMSRSQIQQQPQVQSESAVQYSVVNYLSLMVHDDKVENTFDKSAVIYISRFNLGEIYQQFVKLTSILEIQKNKNDCQYYQQIYPDYRDCMMLI